MRRTERKKYLELGHLEGQQILELFVLLLSELGPKRLDGLPEVPESLVERVAVLRDDSLDQLRPSKGEPKNPEEEEKSVKKALRDRKKDEPEGGGRAVVEEVHEERLEAELVDELFDGLGERVEGVLVGGWDSSKAESGEIGGLVKREDDVRIRRGGKEEKRDARSLGSRS